MIKRQPLGDTVVLKFRGKLTIGAGEVELREAVREELDRGFRKIVLDLSELSSIDSMGLGELVSTFTSVTNQGGNFKLVGGPQKLEDVLTITQLASVFDIYPDAEKAVASFQKEQ